MTSIPKLIAFFITVVYIFCLFTDFTVIAFGKADYQSGINAAAEKAVLKHMDWAALRVGDPPYLIQEGLEETIRDSMNQNANLRAENLRALMVSESTPAYLALTMNTHYTSSTLKLLNQNVATVEIPVRVVEIIESKYTDYNY
ncbi:hypothetical protein [Brevibacillus marinus]|uniref:hypothetical protein n=1 Tax=Brevibacillus marinus TaxID=2496837 RepID=UPI000F819303|nr:hypothetical protein [Brevibacillus marinus]